MEAGKLKDLKIIKLNAYLKKCYCC